MGKYDKVLSDPRYSGLNDSDKALFWDKIFKRDIATDSRYGSLNESEKATAYSKFLSKYMTPTDNAPASVIPEGIGKMNLLDEKTTFSALFSCNDDMALGASKALHQAGLRIPQDVSLFGFDDAPASNTLDSHVSRLRRRLSDAGAGVAIHALRGVGYMAKAE